MNFSLLKADSSFSKSSIEKSGFSISQRPDLSLTQESCSDCTLFPQHTETRPGKIIGASKSFILKFIWCLNDKEEIRASIFYFLILLFITFKL